MAKHVYADANIFLDFFRFSEDDLDELAKLSSHLDAGEVILHIPELTTEEYYRNRDKVVLAQLQELKKTTLKVGMPIFIRDMELAKTYLQALAAAFSARATLLEEVENSACTRSFRADALIDSIFEKSNKIATDAELIQRAQQRLALGNPPGKPASLGDRVNWESLLEAVPDGNDLYLLTRDNDYLTSFPAVAPNMFITSEWKKKKNGNIIHFKGIKPFAKHVDDTIVFQADNAEVFPSDPERTAAITNLAASWSFADTHTAIAGLQQYLNSFSPHELEELLEIAMANSQVGGIMGDSDVESFYLEVRNKLAWAGNAVADRFDETYGNLAVPF